MLRLDLEDLDLVPNSAFAVIISQPSCASVFLIRKMGTAIAFDPPDWTIMKGEIMHARILYKL